MGKKMNVSKQKNKGFTLIELALVLAVVGIVSYMLAPVFESVIAGVEADSEAKITQNYFSDLKSKKRRGPYTGLDNDFVIDARIPDQASITGSSISNSWGHAQTWAAGTLTGGIANGAKQLTNPVPPNSCLAYVSQMSPFVDELLVGSTVVKAVGAQLNESTAATACNVSTNTVNVIMRKS